MKESRYKLLIALIILIIGTAANQLSSVFLYNKYHDTLPVLNDLILDNIPFLKIAVVYDFIAFLPYIFLVWHVWKHNKKELPYILVLFGIFNFVRGVFIALTPLGSPNDEMVGLFYGKMFRVGAFPSGHTGGAFMAYLVTKAKLLRWIMLFLVLLVIITLFLGHGHYSIDILSALFFSYAIYCFGESHLKKWFICSA